MHSMKLDSRGFTLIASLMLMLIMSGVAIGLLMMVNTEGKVGGQDVQNNLAFHAAEGGIEHMTSDLANMFQNIESPTAAQIAALSADAPANSASHELSRLYLDGGHECQWNPVNQFRTDYLRTIPGLIRAGYPHHPASNGKHLCRGCRKRDGRR